jgi:hypothetical protein
MVAALAVGAVALVVVSNPRNDDARCVGPRVAIKTLSDSGDVSFRPVPAQLDQLANLHRPRRLSQRKRSRPIEAKTFRINARLVSMRLRADDEIFMVASSTQAPARTMLVVFEGARICSHSAVVRAESPMKNARNALFAACGKLAKLPVKLSGTAVIDGVGYFGPKGVEGAARNGIELHPVLRFKSADCRRRS